MTPRALGDDDSKGFGVRLVDDLVMTLRFFSRLPTGRSPHLQPDLSRIAPVLPAAALIMGLVPALLFIAGAYVGIPGYFAATLAVVAMVVIGGGMMEDSIADAADGLFGGGTAERRLEILKDSRHGTFGVSALCLFLVLRVTALGSLVAIHPLAAAGIWLASNIAGRSASLWVAVALPPARRDGASASVGQLPRGRFIIGAGLASVMALALAASSAGLIGGLAALLAVALVVIGWTRTCRRLVGGQTGDLIGAAGGLGEVAALCLLLIFV